jgi:hypothetical protein
LPTALKTSKPKKISEDVNEFDGLMNRARMARYIQANCKNPDTCLSEIKGYCKERADIIKDVQRMAKSV